MTKKPESKLQLKIQKYLEGRGAFVFKVHGGPFMMAGLPDLIVCYRGKFMGFEIKMPGENPTPIQERVMQKIVKAGGLASVLRSVEDAETWMNSIDNPDWS